MEANYTEGKTKAVSVQERADRAEMSRAEEGHGCALSQQGVKKGLVSACWVWGHSDRTTVGTLARDRCAAACSCLPQRATEMGTAVRRSD